MDREPTKQDINDPRAGPPKRERRATGPIVIRKSTVYIVLATALLFFALGFFAHSFFYPGNPTQTAVKASADSNPASARPEPDQAAAGRITVSVDDDPVLGREDAPLTIIEFSDFQCPFCRTFWSRTLDQLTTNYIDTGRIKFVYRDFPISSIHPGAQPAAEATECADDQGKYWEMHDKIFERQNEQGRGTVQFDVADLKAWAAEIGLNMEEFNDCLDSGKYAQEVQKDLLDGQRAGVRGTPTFFIGTEQDGYVELVGAQPYAAFRQVIEAELELATGGGG